MAGFRSATALVSITCHSRWRHDHCSQGWTHLWSLDTMYLVVTTVPVSCLSSCHVSRCDTSLSNVLIVKLRCTGGLRNCGHENIICHCYRRPGILITNKLIRWLMMAIFDQLIGGHHLQSSVFLVTKNNNINVLIENHRVKNSCYLLSDVIISR